jgi:hypothetical protein
MLYFYVILCYIISYYYYYYYYYIWYLYDETIADLNIVKSETSVRGAGGEIDTPIDHNIMLEKCNLMNQNLDLKDNHVKS